MKSTLINFCFLLGTLDIAAQISLQNPNATMPAGIQAPGAPSLGDMRYNEQQRIQQQNAIILQMHNAKAQSQQQQLREINEEMRQDERQQRPISYEFPESQQHSVQYFKQSFLELQNMLDGKQDLSLKRAVFLSENAFLDNSLSYDWFCNDIATNLDVLQSFMVKEKLDLKNDIAKKYMLQKFFSDTLTMRDDKGKPQFTHYPFKYDFDDPYGSKDWRKMFVTKLIRDKKGQCHSLPLLYLIFAEELNIKAWLSYSPQHSYIKTQDSKGIWYNFETTNGQYSSDTWLLSSGYVKTEAMKNKIYMDTLSKKETIAACLVDLANAYTQKLGYDKYVLTCADKALQYNPKNIFAWQLKSNYYTFLLRHVAKQFNYPPQEDLHLYPKLYEIYQKTYELHQFIENSGFEEMPLDMYKAWLLSFEKEKNKQPIKIIRP